LGRAATQADFNAAWARKDPDLQWVRDDAECGARFAEIVGSA
jgi:hypothetical protein